MPRRTLPVLPFAPALLGAAALLAGPARAAPPAGEPDRVLGAIWCEEAGIFSASTRETPLIPALSQVGVAAMVGMPGLDSTGPIELLVRADGATRVALRAKPSEIGALVEHLRSDGWVGEAPLLRKAGATYAESIQIDAAGAVVYERRFGGGGAGPLPSADAVVGGLRARGGCGAYADTRSVGLLGGGDFDAAIVWFAKDMRSLELRLQRGQPITPPPIIPPVVVESPGASVAVFTLGAAPAELFDAMARLPLPPKVRSGLAEGRQKLGDDRVPGAGMVVRFGKGPLGGVEMIGAIPTGADGARGSRWRSRRMLNAAVRAMSDELLEQGGAAPIRIDRSTWRVSLVRRKEAITLRAADGLLLFSTSVDSMLGVGSAGGAPWLGAEAQAWAAAHHVALIGALPGALLGLEEGASVDLRVGLRAEAEQAVLRMESSVPFDQLMKSLPPRAAGALQGPLNLGQPLL
ncbi:MAG: hypothetical protein JNM72_04590 [Deltaproteobacteria bacterium]|nr:hypothetical protein [Deltaproteobacteria bacterium]